ncbi:hypothetical protein ACGF12_22875 [Kitasatospora sp. NPDC048296]|uniref:hypothetical protein n=1 Tax=Kitasatospora sp. NPDC048296 TaxID=3364048 RepID=UPI00371B3B7E
MISIGRKVIDREGVAALAGKAVGTLRNAGCFKELTVLAGRGPGSKELYDLEQARVAAANARRPKGESPAPIPALTDLGALGADELRALAREVLIEEAKDGAETDLTVEALDSLDEQELRTWVRGRELLTLEEARMALPEERRPTKSTMESYFHGSKATRLPEPDAEFYGVAFWRRATIERWNAEGRRPAHGIKGHGRPAGTGAASSAPEQPAATGQCAQAEAADVEAAPQPAEEAPRTSAPVPAAVTSPAPVDGCSMPPAGEPGAGIADLPAPRSRPHPKAGLICDLLLQGHTNAEIRRRTGADLQAIARLRTRCGVGPAAAPARRHPKEAEIRAMLKTHSTLGISRALGVDKAAVARIRKDAGITWAQPQKWGTVTKKWLDNLVPVDGGHVQWNGPRAGRSGTPVLRFRERPFSPGALSFRWATGRDPVGQAFAECGFRHCMAPDHVDDETGRAKVREQVRHLSGGTARPARCRHGHDQGEHGRYGPDGVAYCEACKRAARHARKS